MTTQTMMPLAPPCPRRRRYCPAILLFIMCASLGLGCAGSGDEDRPPADVTIDNPRAARLAGTWIGFNQSPNAPWEFVSATFEKQGGYSTVLHGAGQQTEQSGRWRVEGDELVLDGKQKWELEFRGENMVVLVDPGARVFHQLARKR